MSPTLAHTCLHLCLDTIHSSDQRQQPITSYIRSQTMTGTSSSSTNTSSNTSSSSPPAMIVDDHVETIRRSGRRVPGREEMNAIFAMCRKNLWESVLYCVQANPLIPVTVSPKTKVSRSSSMVSFECKILQCFL